MSKKWWEEYGKRVDYIYMPKKIRPTLHVLRGFKNLERAKSRYEELLLQNATPFHLEIQRLSQDEWGVIFDESILPFLVEKEKNNLVDAFYPVPIKQYTPRIFRYMDKKFVDKFFETGELRLSSFEAFSRLENANLRDEKEGNLKLTVKYGDKVAEAEMGFGQDAFVLCATTLNTEQEDTKNTFGHNCGFSIEDVNGFINAVINAFHTMCIKKGDKVHRLQVENVQHGPCMYLLSREHDALIIENNGNSLTEFLCGGNDIVVDDMIKTFSQYAGEHGMFLKLADHKDEHEYRILWHIEMDEVPPEIFISVPEAIKYCRKINL